VKQRNVVSSGIIATTLILSLSACSIPIVKDSGPSPIINNNKDIRTDKTAQQSPEELVQEEVATSYQEFLTGIYSMSEEDKEAFSSLVGASEQETDSPDEQKSFLIAGMLDILPVLDKIDTSNTSVSGQGQIYAVIISMGLQSIGYGYNAEVPSNSVTLLDDKTAVIDSQEIIFSLDGQPLPDEEIDNLIAETTMNRVDGKWKIDPTVYLEYALSQ
jgi:hypothetical protein